MERDSSSLSLPEATDQLQELGEHRAHIAQRVDGLIVGRYRDAVRQGGDDMATVGMQQCCVMALGGYGRRELAPQSDIDLMFLFEPGADIPVESLVRAVLNPLWDCGFQVGHSVRTIADSIDSVRLF